MSNKEEMIAEKTYTDYYLPNDIMVDRVHAKVFEVEIDNGRYGKHEEKFGVEVVFYDDMLDGGEYEYYHTIGVERIDPGRIQAFYIKKVKKADVFDSIEELVIRQIDIAEREVIEKLTEPEHEVVEADSTEDRARAALDALEDIQEENKEQEFN